MFWLTSPDLSKHQKLIRRGIITKISFAVVLIIIPLLSIILDPIRLAIKYGTTVKNGSFLFNIFQTEIEGARLSLYVFNITNSEKFLSGEDHKLKVQEVGPFAYRIPSSDRILTGLNRKYEVSPLTKQKPKRFMCAYAYLKSSLDFSGITWEIRRNGDIELDEPAGEMWFTPHMKVRFLPEESVGDPHQIRVTVPSLALMSATSLLRTYPFWIQQGFNVIAHQLGSRIISSLDAHSFLWGYNDPMIALANKLAPGLIYFDRLGIIDRLYDNSTLYRMKVGITEDDKWSIKVLRKYLKGRNEGGQTPLEDFNFTDTYEGMSYPPGLTPSSPLNIYRIGVCRPLNLEFVGHRSLDYGPRGMVFRISNETFHRDCGKPQGMCGMLDLSECTYGIPIAISRTHFLHSEPKLYERVEGMAPNEDLHESHFLMEPKMGFELQTNLTLQLNIVLGDVSFNKEASRFSNMTVPIAYIKVEQPEIFDMLKVILKIAYVWGPGLLLFLEIVMFIAGPVLLTRALKVYWNHRHCDSQTSIIEHEKQVPLMT